MNTKEQLVTIQKNIENSPIETHHPTTWEDGHGNYKSVWSLDDKYVGSTEFEIIPSGK